MSTTRDLVPLAPIRTISGASFLVMSFPEAASQTFKKGEAVYIDGAGQIAEYTSAIDDGTQRFLGFAAADGSNGAAGANEVLVHVATDDVIFEANIYHGTLGSAVTAQTDLGTLLPMKQLTATAGGIVAVDKENTAGQIDCFRIVGFSKLNDIGDTYGRVHVVVEAAARQFFQ